MNILLAVCILAFGATFDRSTKPNTSGIRTMPVARTPESNTISLRIAIPKPGQVVSNPAWLQFRIEGFALGAGSNQFERASELAISKMGQTVHVVIDNYPYFPVNDPPIDPFDESGYFYDMSYKVEIPYRLKEGMHTIRMFPARSFGESLKGDNTFVAIPFYIGDRKDNPDMDLSQPYITYNEPSNNMYLTENKPVLLDFYVTNAELSSDGYKVRLTIDGKINRTITSWQPYYIYGLKRGKHTIRLELIDEMGKVVPGIFNVVEETITIH
jgi:hypothetical protein